MPESKFDFSTWGTVTVLPGEVETGTDILKEANACGTTACALGWAPSLPFAKRLGFKFLINSEGFTHFSKNGKNVTATQMASELFGLKPYAASFIFHGSRLTEGETKYDVARGIRDFVAIRFG
jgi:hypothetical protein